MKGNKHFEEYQSPECIQIELQLEGAVLAASGSDDEWGVFEDNAIFGEDF